MSVFWGINWKYGFVFIFPLIHWFCFSEQKSFENIRFMKLIYVFHNFTYNFTRFSTLWIKWIRKHEIKNYNIQNIWTSSYSQYILIIINNYWILEKCNPPTPTPRPAVGSSCKVYTCIFYYYTTWLLLLSVHIFRKFIKHYVHINNHASMRTN